MGVESGSLASTTGASLNLYLREANATPRGIIQINHGLAEHAARYGRFMEALAEAGFHSISHDHRGHGATSAPDAPQGSFAREGGVDKVLGDVAAIQDHARALWPGLPLITFGHSMGGLIAMNFALRHPEGLAGLAVWNANFSAGLLGRVAQSLLAWERFRLGSDTPSRILPKLTFADWAKKVPGARTDFDWLSRDPAEVDKYVADPLCGWDASVAMWQDVFRMVFAGADDANFAALPRTLPIQLRGGEKDPATEGGKAVLAFETRLRSMGFTDVDAAIFPDTRHESLNEVNRDEATAEFVAWAQRVTAAR